MAVRNAEEKVIRERLLRNNGSHVVLPSEQPPEASSQALSLALQSLYARQKTIYRLQENPADRVDIQTRPGLAGKALLFVRRAARKLFLRWYVEPVAQQQTQFNREVVQLFKETTALQAQLVQLLERMEAQQEASTDEEA